MPDGAPPLQNWNTANQWLYHNYVSEMKEICTNLKADLQELKQMADTILVILEKEYE